VLGAVAVYLLYAFFRHPVQTGDPGDVPIIGSQIAAHLPDKERSDCTLPEASAEGKQPSEETTRTEAGG